MSGKKKKRDPFFVEVGQELQPLLRHAFVFGTIMLVFYLVALAFRFLETLLPDKVEHLGGALIKAPPTSEAI